MELVALLSNDKESWGQIAGLIKHGDWENIIIVGGETSRSFSAEKKFDLIRVDLGNKIKDLTEEITKKLKGKIKDMEVALTIASGDGKEHMALISALINLPVGIRFVALTKEGVVNL
ncbi:hypothetical protein HYT24_01865 [Candidatus Pacearchaeota archaeon]|nr:hypothetical protein [Candidatus Pacearchaeota archaeon]